MPPPKVDQPWLFLIAGPNGSGKSSVYQDADFETEGRSVWIVNPDLLTARIQRSENLDMSLANIAAVNRIWSWLDASLSVHQTVGVETVLSTDKYRTMVQRAKSLGFAIWLIYVVLDSPERNVERVRLRVAKGGHDVPENKIRERYVRSLQQFPWFLDQADVALIYDNSKAQPKLIAEKRDGVVPLYENALQAVVDAAKSIRTD